jgi:hypothetical protein
MKLMVIGYKRHGKDTFCEILRDKYGFSFASSSETACDLFIFDEMKDEFGYKTKLECFEDRGNHRQLWYDKICKYVEGDLTRLGRKIYERADVYCGCRDDKEFYAMKAENSFDLSIWVDAGDRKPPEDASSMKLSKSDAMITANNNGNLVELEAEVDRIYENYILPILRKERAASRKNEAVSEFGM